MREPKSFDELWDDVLKNPSNERVTEYDPLFVPLTDDFISRHGYCEPETAELERAQTSFMQMLRLFVEPLTSISYPSNPQEIKWAVDCIRDINHLCVKYGQILHASGCGNMLWEVKRKNAIDT